MSGKSKMFIQFATCERKRALCFLQNSYPNGRIADTDDSAKAVLDLVEADIVRIPDPYMYGLRVAIRPSTHWDENKKSKYIAILKEFHNRALKKNPESQNNWQRKSDGEGML